MSVDAWPEQTEAVDVEASPLRAVEDIKMWLSLNDGEVAELCGFSRRSLLNWRKGSDAYGASTRKLLAVHALVSSLNSNWGSGTTRLWFEGPDVRGKSRLESIATEVDGLRLAIADVSGVLFVRPSSYNAADVNAGMTDKEVSAVMANPAMVNGPTGRTTARRVRKPGSART